LLGAALVVGCGENTVAPPVSTQVLGPNPEGIQFNPALLVDLDAMTKTESGLYWQDLLVGTGEEAVVGRFISVQYNGWLPDGTLFDSSAGSGPFSFELGAGVVIRGWEEGLPGMLEAGVRRLIIPARLAYGATGSGVIPPNAVLVFDVGLSDVLE